MKINVNQFAEKERHKLFHFANLHEGRVDSYLIDSIEETNGKFIVNVTNYVNGHSRKWSFQSRSQADYELTDDYEEAKAEVDNKIKQIESMLDTKEKMLQYFFDRAIYPIYDMSYHDIVADKTITPLELTILKEKVEEHFGYEVEPEKKV